MRYYYFEKLDVWQLSKNLSVEIYKLTESYPKNEIFSLVNQIRRATVSVASNIAEGSGRISGRDTAHFIQLAYGSLMEVLNQILISKDLNFISEDKYLDMRSRIEEISNKLNALRTSYLTKFTNSRIHKST